MKEIFSRSQEKYGVQNVNYIGDGNLKTFKAILDLNPYDNDRLVKKVHALEMSKNEWPPDFEL